MAAGTPVLASSTPAVAEVAAPAALLVDPADEPGWAAALGRLLPESALCAAMAARGRTVAARFTWPHCAASTLAVYRTVL
jgi:glycosyltransferase involved in cell wall biosynthesis